MSKMENLKGRKHWGKCNYNLKNNLKSQFYKRREGCLFLLPGMQR